MNTILFGMLGFTITIVVLTVLLLIVKARLSPGGTVKVGINHDEEKTLEVRPAGRSSAPSRVTDLHSVGVRRQGHLRRLPLPGQLRRRRAAAH